MKKILVIGTVFFAVFILISSATAVQLTNKEATENLIKKTDFEETIINGDYNNLADIITQSDIDIHCLLLTLYNSQEFIDSFNLYKTNILNDIDNTFSVKNRPLVKQLFSIEETFNLNSLANRISNVNYDPDQLVLFIQDKLEVADDLGELQNNYQDKASIFLEICYKKSGDPDPDSEGLHTFINNMSEGISFTYKAMIGILEPLLGAVGKLVAILAYINILVILLFPVIIPMILAESSLDALEYDPNLIDDLWDIYQNHDFAGFLVYGGLAVLKCIIQDKYLFQATKEIGRKLLLKDYEVYPDGEVHNLEFVQTSPEPQEMEKPKYKGGGNSYKFEFKALVNEVDKVDAKLRDMVQVGWDFDNDGTIDVWSDLTMNRVIKTDYTYPTSGEKTIRYISKDQWGALGEWSESIGIFVNHAPNTPSISGPEKLKRNEKGKFRTIAKDPESDKVWYQWKYDGVFSDWEGPYESEQAVNFVIEFVSGGEHSIRSRAKDNHGWESGWSEEITVTVPKAKKKSLLINIFDLLNLERIPLINKLLNIN